MKKYVFGVDIGGTTVKLGLFDMDGGILAKWEIPTVTANRGEAILPDITDSIKAKMEEKNIAMEEVAGIGLGAPGPIDAAGTVYKTANLGWDTVFNIPEAMNKLIPLPVRAGNDANVAALGEMWQGGGKGYQDIVMVTLGTGVGGGVIIGQKIIAGNHGLSGEIGHIHVRDEETEHCNCGGVGCLEQIASATGIAREARRKMAASDIPSMMREFGDQITAKDVLDSAKAGDELANEVMEIVGRYLGLALAQVSLIVDPEVFVIGGGVSRAGQFLIDKIYKYYDQFTAISRNKAGIVLATLGNDAGIYGAARQILD